MKVVHISDTHGYHDRLIIPECDVLIHSGDIGGRTGIFDLTQFLIWFEKQRAKVKILVPGNHDIILDKKGVQNGQDSITRMLHAQGHRDALELISKYDIKYLCDSEFIYEGVKFYGSPYSPSFHRANWVFNADRGQEISNKWSKIPSDTHVLITHTPPYGLLDNLHEYTREGEDPNAGCKDLIEVIKGRLFRLKLHCFGHIHDNTGMIITKISGTRRVVFSNGCALSNKYEQLYVTPNIIYLNL
jgi:Icc-related predicted phosphoesterase